MGDWARTVSVHAAVDLGERDRRLLPGGFMVVVVVRDGACRIAAAASAAAAVSACVCCEQNRKCDLSQQVSFGTRRSVRFRVISRHFRFVINCFRSS